MCIGRAARLCEYGQDILAIAGTTRRETLQQLNAVAAQVGFGIGAGVSVASSSSSSSSSSSKASASSVNSAHGSGSGGIRESGADASDNGASSSSSSSGAVRPALLIDGVALQLCLEHAERQFMELALDAPAVICCRCSPTQKAQARYDLGMEMKRGNQ